MYQIGHVPEKPQCALVLALLVEIGVRVRRIGGHLARKGLLPLLRERRAVQVDYYIHAGVGGPAWGERRVRKGDEMNERRVEVREEAA